MGKSRKTNVMNAVFNGREGDLKGAEKATFDRMFTKIDNGAKLSAATEVKDFDFNGDFGAGFRHGNKRKAMAAMKVLKRKSDRAKGKKVDLSGD
jgi:hypothetical protein